MKNYRLVTAILGSAFLIDEKFAHSFLPGVFRMMNHEEAKFYGDPTSGLFDSIIEENRAANRDFVLSPQGNSWVEAQSLDDIAPGSIHVLRLHGAVMKDDWCGVPGSKTIKEQLAQSKLNPNIIGAVFSTDTGGGQVDGTFELADEIAAYGKPIIGYVDGRSCSAGYAFMSRCTEIMLSHKTTEVGSIGTAVSFWDTTKADEMDGYKLVYINSTTSPDKNQDYFKALEGKFELMQEDLDYLNEIFQTSVKAGRPGIAAEAITGKCFRGDKAIGYKMADSYGTLNDAINRVQELVINK